MDDPNGGSFMSPVLDQPASSGDASPSSSPTPAPAAASPAAATPAPIVAAAAPTPAQQHGSWMASILHAVGDAIEGPKTRLVVDPTTGKIIPQDMTRGQRIGNMIATVARGAAAGAAAHGPGAVGQGAILGMNAEAQAEAAQQKSMEAQSKSIQTSRFMSDRERMTQATLAKMSQESARSALDMKFLGVQVDAAQLKLINAQRDILNRPGSRLLGHFDSNSDINAHLEQVGPQVATQYVKDLARNNIQLVQNPNGGFDAIEVRKEEGQKPIGDGKKLYTFEPSYDPTTKTWQNNVEEHDADPEMTADEYHAWNGTALTRYNAALESEQNYAAKAAAIAHTKAETTQQYALTAQEKANTQKII